MSGSQADFWQGPTGTLPVVNANGNIFEEAQVASGGQTVFTLLSFTYTPGQKSIWVFRRPVATDIGGEMLRRAVDYVETSSAIITLTSPAAAGDTLIFIGFGINQLIAPVVNNGLPQGGVSGAILRKNSGSDYDATWSPQSAVGTLLDALRINIASASTVDLSSIAAITRNVQITGNVQIDGFAIVAGQVWAVKFASALTLKNNGTIVTETGSDITTVANATCFLRATSDNVVEVLCYNGPKGNLSASKLNNGAFGRRNALINGCFTNAQRGSQTLAASGTLNSACDMWYVDISATTVNITSSQIASGASSASGTAHQLVITTTGTTNITEYQRIESKITKRYSGKTITVSGRIRHNASTNLSLIVSLLKPNAIDNYAGSTPIINLGPVTLLNGNVDNDFNLQYVSGATDFDNGLQINFGISTAPAMTGVTVVFSNHQFEEGDVVTPIELISPALTDLECKRYLFCTNPGSPKSGGIGAIGEIGVATTITGGNVRFPVGMRATPTIQVWNAGVQNQIRNSSSGVTQVNVPAAFLGVNSGGFGNISWTTAAIVVGTSYDFDLIVSAEL